MINFWMRLQAPGSPGKLVWLSVIAIGLLTISSWLGADSVFPRSSRYAACWILRMILRTFVVAAVLLQASLGAIAAEPFTSLHPEEAHPDPTEKSSPDAYTGFITRVQQKLHVLGFDAGPANGDFGAKTQAALAQFQLSRVIPAGGQLDDQTLAELGVERDGTQASAGGSGLQLPR